MSLEKDITTILENDIFKSVSDKEAGSRKQEWGKIRYVKGKPTPKAIDRLREIYAEIDAESIKENYDVSDIYELCYEGITGWKEVVPEDIIEKLYDDYDNEDEKDQAKWKTIEDYAKEVIKRYD